MSDRHNEVRRIFEMHGIRAKDGRPPSEMTDEEIEEALRALMRSVTAMGRALRPAIVRMSEAMIEAGRRVSALAPLLEVERRRKGA